MRISLRFNFASWTKCTKNSTKGGKCPPDCPMRYHLGSLIYCGSEPCPQRLELDDWDREKKSREDPGDEVQLFLFKQGEECLTRPKSRCNQKKVVDLFYANDHTLRCQRCEFQKHFFP